MVSTTALMETQFAERFNEFISSEREESIRAIRAQAFQAFTAMGYPTLRDEDWKYTNISPIAGKTWTVQAPEQNAPTADTDALRAFNYMRNGFTAMHLAFANIQVVRISSDTVVEEPIKLHFEAESGSAIFPHIIVIAEAGCKATIVEYYSSPAESFTNTAVQVFVESNANLTHCRVQKDGPDAYHVGTTEVMLGAASRYDSTNINLGGAISRHDIDLKFTAEGGEAFVDGLYMLNGKQHADTHSIIDHRVPNCISHQTYKGVLNDSSRAVFNGKVFVRENAHGTDAQQSNKNLLLSNDARVDTKPQLEIFNDDVKCSHGATVGQIEQEELFYLLTRGLPETLARNLLTYGFAEEVINKINIESIKTELDAAVLNRLNTNLDG
jgi:Fe-S cluster assembly protein SufD